jgi:beta-barrel assembly-enhancing protease
MRSSRRDFLLRGLCGCSLWSLPSAPFARVLPTDLTPLVTSGYRPRDVDERGLWQECERLEQNIAASRLRLNDPALTQYIRGVTERLLGPQASDLRIYPMRNPDFNAAMTPNGMMIVQSGLLVRMRNEAQFAAVLGHESGHYLRRHTLTTWREVRGRTALMSVLGVVGGAVAGDLGYGLATGINVSLALSLFSFSRELESEADAFGLKLLKGANYPPEAAAEIWTQLISERKASASERHKKYRDKSRSVLSTHPPTEERMRDLTDTAAALPHDAPPDARRDQWRAAVGPLRPMLLEEQVKLNDPGASLYLLDTLAQDGWDGVLRYYQGEVYRLRGDAGDDVLAAKSYAAAVAAPEAPPVAFRAHGYALLRAGQHAEGRQALAHYLELAPQAGDADMVRFSLQQ